VIRVAKTNPSIIDDESEFSDASDSAPLEPSDQRQVATTLDMDIPETAIDGIASHLLATVTQKLLSQTAELTAARHDLDVESLLRKAAEAAIATFEHRYTRAHEQSARYRKRVKTLSRRFVTAQEEERQNISRELHDVVAQSLTGIILRLSALAPGSRNGTETRHKEIAEVQKLIVHAVTVVQRFARDLRPSMLDDLGLTPALASFLDHFSESTRISTRMTSVRLAEALNMEQRTALFRVAQEACNNVSRHAHATAIRMRVHRKGDQLRMVIHDNGQSFSVAAALQAHGRKRLGLLGMKERMRIIGGNLDITSSPKKGTTIVAMLPMSKIGSKAPRCTS
jgi:signal transduction histidine kinase